jgi:hypothetical protein
MVRDLRRALRKSGQASLNLLDLSVEAGQFPLSVLAHDRAASARTRYYAIDRDPVAVALTNRLVEFAKQEAPSQRFRITTTCRDSLLDRLPSEWPKYFGAIVGNPPWQGSNWSGFDPIRERFAPRLVGRVDMYLAFMLRAHELLQPGGYLSMVVPNGFLFNLNATPIRRLLLDEYDVLTLRLYPQRSFVELSSVIPISFLARKRTGGGRSRNRVTTIAYEPGPVGGPARPEGSRRTVVAPAWRRLEGCAFNPVAAPAIRFLLGKLADRKIGDFGVLWSGGRLTRSEAPDSCPFIGIYGRDIRPFHVCPRGIRRYRSGEAKFDRMPRQEFLAKEKVVFQDMRNPTLPERLIAAIAGPNTYPVSTAAMFVPHDESAVGYFEALLNSSFANAWYKARDVTRSIKLLHLEDLPVIYDVDTWRRVALLARRCSTVRAFFHHRLEKCPVGREEVNLSVRFPRKHARLLAYERQIDREIFRLYGLTTRHRCAVLQLSSVRAF